MFGFVPLGLQRFGKDILWVTISLLAVTGAIAFAKDPAAAPSWQVILGLFFGTAMRCTLTPEMESPRVLSRRRKFQGWSQAGLR